MAGKKRRKSRKSKLSGFIKFLIAYCSVLVLVIIVALFWLHGLLKDYEEGIPSNTMDKIIKDFNAENIGNIFSQSGVEVSEFETDETVLAYLRDKLDDGDIFYKKKGGEYSENTPVYVVYAGETAIAKVSLASKGKNSHKFNKWTLGEVSFSDYEKDLSSVTITAPTGSNVYINGVKVKETYVTEKDVTFSPCQHVSDYVTTPTNTIYKVDGLIAKPVITADFNGVQLVAEDKDKEGYLINYPSDDALLASEKSHIIDVAESYGRYIINRGSLTQLSGYMTGYAAEYVSDIPAIWAFLYGKTYTYEFKNEAITNFRKYSDDCYSCDIYYDLYVNWNSGDVTYDTSMTYTFVKKDGSWVLADFIIN